MRIKARHTFFFLSTLFLIYSFTIYITPMVTTDNTHYDQTEAAEGRLVWQEYNCQSCHQFYGLGGYLGPDLTNIMSQPGKGELYLKAMVKSGTKQMPSFTVPDKKMKELIEFLKSVDASGKADPRTFETNKFGMIEGNESK